jgi:TPR repeat protein
VKWWRKAAKQDNADAQFNLGWCYAEGLGVVQNWKEAVEGYREAVKQKHANAQFHL